MIELRLSTTQDDYYGYYRCGRSSLCKSCRLRFHCFTQRGGEIIIPFDDIIAKNKKHKSYIEWVFALEEYLFGEPLGLKEVAVRSEAIYQTRFEKPL